MKYIFPFYGKKYEFLEKKWWHRLMKIIFFMAVLTCFLFSATIYFNFEIKAPEIIYQITSDVLAGMKPTDIEKNYPEMKWQDLTIFAQLASDIADGMPVSQAPRLYPDIFTQEAIDWGKTQPIVNRGDIYPQNVVQNAQQRQIGITAIVKDAPWFLERFNVAWSYFKIVIYTIITTYLLMLFFQIIYFKGIIYIMYGDNLEQLKK